MKKTLVPALLLPIAMLARADGATYLADPYHTAVTFEYKHAATSTMRGRFNKKDGSVTLDRAAQTGRAEFTIDMASVDTGIPPLDAKLKSKDMFNAAEFGTARFVGDQFTFVDGQVTSVSGQLTLIGRTLPLTLRAANFNCYDNPVVKREVCGGDFDATLVRSLWGMDYGVKTGLTDAIHLLIEVEAVRQ